MKSSFGKLKTISEKPWFYPMALFLIAALTYGYTLTALGYYWSDWEVVFFTKLAPTLQPGFYADDRPFPWTYQLIHFLVGSNPIGWQVVTLLLRWAGVLFFVYAMIQVWSQYKKQIYWLGALLIVYPGFVQQAQSAAFSRHIMALCLFALSLYLMALAIKRPASARWLFPLSWIITFLHLFTIEYFSGLELARPVLIWILVTNGSKKDSQLLRKAALYSLPYILITAFFLWARFIYYPSVFQTSSPVGKFAATLGDLQGSFIATVLDFFNRVALDVLYSTVQVWTDAIIGFGGFTFQQRIAWFAFGVGALFALALSFFYNTSEEEASNRPSPVSVILIGLLMFVTSALPIWAIGKEVSTGGWNVRFTLAPMFGACLTVVGLALLLVRPAGQKWIFGFLLMFSVATQVWITNVYRRDWTIQPEYYWQLYWRAPALQADTAVYSFGYPSYMITHDLDATWAINILYHFQVKDGLMPYMFVTPEYEMYFQPNTPIKERVRNVAFIGNTSDVISILHQTDASCLRILDTIYAYDPLLDDGSDKLIPVSDLSRIIPGPSPASPDTDVFGPEPPHTWCYFFQKADLARQTQDWDTVLDLYEQAQQLGFSPGYGAEHIPFIEAYAQTGDWQSAYDLTIAAANLTSRQKRMLCTNWYRFAEFPSADMKWIERIVQELPC
ncbi:MAG: hypothetical protein DCC56_15910 [Anaerolineae bacterium]|nr:MAG: hypothetical protein DCC56_15910 [Anaerolineae bacterium]WKZ42928.1 MAG: hypothetical protein QY302_12575 [Anaerolineales bacterium]